MALHTVIDSFDKAPTYGITVGGSTLRDVISVDVGHSISELSSASVTVLNVSGVKPNDKIVINQGYDGQTVTTFTGFVDDIEWDENDEVWVISARDVLKNAIDTFLVQEVKYGLDVDQQKWYYSDFTTTSGGMFESMEYDSIGALESAHPDASGAYSSEGVKAEFVVKKLLTLSGLNEYQIEVNDTEFWIGDISPATFHLESVYDACNRIADLIGWNVYATNAGIVRFAKRPRMQNDAAKIWTYRADGNPWNIDQLSYNTSNTDLRNYVEVHGYQGIKVVKRVGSPYIGSVPYKGVLIANDLIDTSGMAQFFAHRVLEDLSRLQETVNMGMDGNPYLFPRFSVFVDSSKFTGTVLIEDVSSSMSADGGYKMSLNGRAFVTPIEDTSELPADIVPVIGIEKCVAVGDPTYITLFTGLASYSYAGPIVSYEWNFPDSHAVGGTAWKSIKDTLITGGNTYPVTLTVTDLQGNVGSVTSGFTLDDIRRLVDLKYRHLYAALTDRAVGSEDGGATWTSNASIQPISVAASNFMASGMYAPSGYALFGDQSGNIWITYDVCQTVANVYTVSDGTPVLDLHIPEQDGSYALAGTEGGGVYASDDFGETWEQIGEFETPVYQVRHAWDSFDYVMVVCSGIDQLYHSFNRGADWIQDTGPTASGGYSLLWNTPGSASNYFAHEAGLIAYEYNTTAHDITFSGGTPAEVVTGTVDIDNNAHVMVADNSGQLWNMYSGGVPVDTLTHMVPMADMSENKVRHMLRDGEIPIIYHATQSGFYKSLDYNDTLQELYVASGVGMPESPVHTVSLGLGTNGFGEQVAFGPLVSEPVPRGRLVVVGTDMKWNGSGAGEEGTFLNRGRYAWERFTTHAPKDVLLTTGPDVCYIARKSSVPEAFRDESGMNYVLDQLLIDPVSSGFTFTEEYYRFPEVNHGTSVNDELLAAPGAPKVIKYNPTTDSVVGIQEDWRSILSYANNTTRVHHYQFNVGSIGTNPTHAYIEGTNTGSYTDPNTQNYSVTDISPAGQFVVKANFWSGTNFLWNFKAWNIPPNVKFSNQGDFEGKTVLLWACWDDTDFNMLYYVTKDWDEIGIHYTRYFYCDDPDSIVNSNNELVVEAPMADVVGAIAFHRFQNTILFATPSKVYKILDRGLREDPEVVFELPPEAGDFEDNKILGITCAHGYGGFFDYVVVLYQLDASSPLRSTHNKYTFVLSIDWGKTWEIIAEVNADDIRSFQYIPPSA